MTLWLFLSVTSVSVINESYFTLLHFTLLYFTLLYFISFTLLHFTLLYFTSFHRIYRLVTSQYFCYFYIFFFFSFYYLTKYWIIKLILFLYYSTFDFSISYSSLLILDISHRLRRCHLQHAEARGTLDQLRYWFRTAHEDAVMVYTVLNEAIIPY